MKRIIKEIRLKKDTPDHGAGELFVLMSNNGIYEIDAGEDDPAVFYGGDIKNFDEWFDPVTDKWPQKDDAFWSISADGTSFLDSWHNYTTDRKKMAIGNVFKTRVSAQRFINYLEAVETIRHDEGFMKYNKTCCEVWELRRMYLDVNGRFTAHKVESEFLHHLGAFYFDTEEHAIASGEKHPNEWKTILNYDWSKGEDDNEED